MTKRLKGVVVGVAFVSLALVPAAWAGGPDTHFTGHEQTATASCSGGSGFTVDGNALFGQLTETAAWNAGDHGTTCTASLD